MLFRSDAGLVDRDRALPGLGLLLDCDALGEAIERNLGERLFSSFRVDYIRYKPGRNCLVRFQGATSTGEALIDGYAKAYRFDAGVKIEKAGIRHTIDSRLGPGRIVLAEWMVEICLAPNDNKLDQLPGLLGPDNGRALLDRLQPEGADWSQGRLTRLNYKPERRYVARFDLPNGPPAIIRLYGENEYGAALARVMKRISSEVKIPSIIGRSNGNRALAVTWLPGCPLAGFFTGSPGLIAAVEAAGAALAAFHQSAMPSGLPVYSRADRRRRVRATSEMLGALLPEVTGEAGDIGGMIHSALSAGSPALGLIHGDLHPSQIILDDTTTGLIDLDEIRLGEPAYDLGLLVAHFDRDALSMGWPASLPEEWADALFRGYRWEGGRLDPQRIIVHRAAGLFQLLPHYFRNRDPNWPEQIRLGLERTRQLLAAAVSPPAGAGRS